jgi:ligand-binding sensor domain-containing protein/two-component sensor histidine kinase
MRAALLVLLVLDLHPASASSRDAGQEGRREPGSPRPWSVTSFLEDADILGRGIFFFDFEADGTAWFAASDGLYRYDGYRWDRFTSADGLPSDYVRSVRVTRDGKLWVGTDRGAGLFDGETFDPAGTESHLAGPSVRRIVEDPDGTVWFCCDQWPPANVPAGLTRYRDGTWKTWRAADGLPSDYVSDVYRDGQGRHWVMTRRGLALFDGDRLRRPLEEAGLPGSRDYIWSVVEDPEGRIVVTTTAWVFTRKNGRWQRLPSGPPRISHGQLTTTVDGAILSCSHEPAARFVEWKDDRFVPIWTSQLDASGGVQHIDEAPDGAIWVAGPDLLARWERSGGEWRSFEDLPPPLLRDAEGGVWFADEDRVLRLIEDRWTDVPGAAGPLVGDGAGGIWMSTASGMARWRSDGLTRYAESTVGIESPHHALVDGAGNLWVLGGDASGPVRFARFDGGTWTQHTLHGVEPTERVAYSTADSREGVWCALRNSETDTYRVLRVTDAGSAEVPLPAAARRYWPPRLRPDHAGRLWLFGFFGLYEMGLDVDSPEWQPITALPGKRVENVAARKDAVWFSYVGTTGGRGGVSRLLDGAWTHFSSAGRDLVEGQQDDLLFYTHPRGVYIVAGGAAATPRLLVPPEPTRAESLVAGPEEDFWLGTGARVFHYRPDGVAPETVIVRGERDIFHGEDLVLRIRGVERFRTLARSQNFDVAVRLDDGPWTDFAPLSEGTVTVGDLTTGDHVVRVRVRDQGRDVDPSPATWSFRLHPVPLQDRAWFRPLAAGVILTVLILAGLSVAARQRENVQRRKKQALEHEILGISEREQRRIGQDLHDGLGQRLTSISFQCEALRSMLKRDDPASSQRLREIGAEVRTAISETRELSHALYPAEIDRGNLEIALGNLVTSIGRVFEGTCTYDHDWSPDVLSREYALNVYRLVQEALGNAIRHAGATKLEVESRRNGGAWIIEVRDDGRGFDADDSDGAGLGLQIMRYRADLIGGRLDVESRSDAGTTIRCTLRVGGRGSGPLRAADADPEIRDKG